MMVMNGMEAKEVGWAVQLWCSKNRDRDENK